MHNRKTECLTFVFIVACTMVLYGCNKSSTGECTPVATIKVAARYSPSIYPANFVDKIDNLYLSYIPGTTFVYEGTNEDGDPLRNTVEVTSKTKVVMGVTCVEVHDKVEVSGVLEEETLDWYAQDTDGNVWYFGEDSKEYSGNKVISTAGSWTAGVGGALPGIVMSAKPKVGEARRQEYMSDVAEDSYETIKLGESVTVKYGKYTDTVKTREWTPLEPCVEENKYYARGVGMARAVMTVGGTEQIQLVSVTKP